MRSYRLLSIRWWLPLAFAVIAAVTALVVAQVFRTQSQAALHGRAQDLAAGSAVGAAARIADASTLEEARTVAAEQARRRRVALFLFDDRGRLLSGPSSQGIAWASVPDTRELLSQALSGRRFVQSTDESPRITVGLPLRTGAASALVEVASRPDLVAAESIVRDRIWVAAAWATLVGALTGLLLSPFITSRIRRIGVAAAAIADGEFEAELSPRFPDELGRLALDVDTMRRRLRASFGQLAGERDQLRSLIEQLHEGVIGIRADLTVAVANARASALLDQDVREGAPLCDPWPATDLRAFARGLFSGSTEPRTIRVAPAAERSYAVTGIPTSGAETAVLVVADVTEQERRERAEREFVANAAHELRTPLTAIASTIEVLQQGAKDDPVERDRFLALIERQTTRLDRLGRALLTLARAQTRAELVELAAVDMASVLREVAEDLELGDSELDLEPGVFALAHADLLRQAIENLVANARRYAEGEGLRVSVRSKGDSVVVEVRDNGPGMAPAAAERAVERFFRSGSRDAAGFGLGLSIAREVTRALGGHLEIETSVGGGTTARMILHRAAAPRAAGTRALPAHAVRR
jgi:signal transduction histidine kinase/HAMP domain-containing protein